MSSTLYALFVGIDNYPPSINRLYGCVNDINVIHDLLQERVADEYYFAPQVLTESQATRSAIIDGFRSHLSKAGKGDVALFYFSGHGSQEKAPPQFWNLEPD